MMTLTSTKIRIFDQLMDFLTRQNMKKKERKKKITKLCDTGYGY